MKIFNSYLSSTKVPDGFMEIERVIILGSSAPQEFLVNRRLRLWDMPISDQPNFWSGSYSDGFYLKELPNGKNQLILKAGDGGEGYVACLFLGNGGVYGVCQLNREVDTSSEAKVDRLFKSAEGSMIKFR